MCLPRNAWVLPSGMKQMSVESGLFAMVMPRAFASARICGFSVSPMGNKECAS